MQKHDEKWKDEPEAKIKRVFRTTKVPFEQEKTQLATVNLPDRMENGTTMQRLFIKKTVNHAGQYVLQDNEQEYERQLKALRRAESNGKIIEVSPLWEGRPFAPPPPPDARDKIIEKLKAENAALKAADDEDTKKPPEPPPDGTQKRAPDGKGDGEAGGSSKGAK